MEFKLSVTGNVEIDNFLKGLPAQYSHRILQAAHAEAAKPLVYKEHLLAPVGRTGHLADSIGVIKTPFKSSSVVGEVQVGPRRGRYKGNAGHLVEFGTVKRKTIKRHPIFGYNRGVMPAKPFAKPAFDQTNAQVLGSIKNTLSIKTVQYAKRTLKKYG